MINQLFSFRGQMFTEPTFEADNFLQDKDGNDTWNIESLVTEVISGQEILFKEHQNLATSYY